MATRSPLHALAFTASLGASILLPTASWAASIGASEPVGFGPTVVSSYCDINTLAGSLGVAKNRSLITSDATEKGPFSGALAPASISAASNLGTKGALLVDAPTLSGGTGAKVSEVRLGSNSWAGYGIAHLDADGSLQATNVHVKFEAGSSDAKFTNATYTASATVTCTDDGNK